MDAADDFAELLVAAHDLRVLVRVLRKFWISELLFDVVELSQ